MAGWMAAAVAAVAAPAPKAGPKKDPLLVGQWALVWVNGERWDPGGPLTETFGADGTVVTRRRVDGREVEETCGYAVDLAARPARLDYLYDPAGRRTEGIFKVEGDTLTICHATGPGDRPKEFARVGTKTALLVYQRVKAKD